VRSPAPNIKSTLAVKSGKAIKYSNRQGEEGHWA